MFGVWNTYGGYQGFRLKMTTLPGWARLVVGLAALPGIVLAALSIVLLMVSILTLLALGLPVYLVVGRLSGRRIEVEQEQPVDVQVTRRVDAKVIE